MLQCKVYRGHSEEPIHLPDNISSLRVVLPNGTAIRLMLDTMLSDRIIIQSLDRALHVEPQASNSLALIPQKRP